ncbi:MAG: hypothetical protein CNE99_04430 [OM182 bacterium MED-G24]|uniref:TonB-dependent receptor n=1 Tax=OM182 bacterium MED-G24 TaxID=1986255 RepID=A0A2A5WU08_9GAMM|nr:MAG: hypothetical protein CNE99_04430 [OM182 bacterium MED-G24]
MTPGSAVDTSEEVFDLRIDDFSLGITPNMTINPDFSQIEADVPQSTVNTRFALFLPERRPFFLAGRDVFTTQMNLVNPRNITEPDVGVKLTGKSGGHVYGLMGARDSVTNIVVSGSQGSFIEQLEVDNTATIGRYRYDFGDAAHVGVLLTDCRTDDYSNDVVSVDGRYRDTQNASLSAQFASSDTRIPATLIARGQSATSDDSAYRIRYGHFGPRWGFGATHQVLGADLRADAGFVA